MSDWKGPKKSLGQNFLVDPAARKAIVEALGVGPSDEVVEIGPGRGALTELLIGGPRRLLAVELDDGLAAELTARWGDRPDFELIHGDALEFPWTERLEDPDRYRLVGNLPYGITGPLFGRLLERPRALRAVVMVQAEVGERILAPAGNRSYGALSVGVRTAFHASRVLRVPRGSFRPVPGVDSVVLALDRIDPAPLSPDEDTLLRTLVRAAFQWRRKQLGTILRRHPDLDRWRSGFAAALAELGIDPRARPETISPEGFVHLLRRLESGD